MKTWLITLPLLCAVGVAQADGPAMLPSSPQPEAAAAPTKVEPARSTWHKPRRLPRGDLRDCLALDGNRAIIRCAETGRKD